MTKLPPMAKAPTRKAASAGGKERITPPKKPLLSREAANLRKGDPAAGRIMAEERQAVRQGVRKPAAPKAKGKGR